MGVVLLISLFTLILSRAGICQVPWCVPANGLIGWWPFNASADDENINANPGTLSGGGYFVLDRFYSSNRAYQGTAQSGIDILTNNLPSGIATISISSWFKSILPYSDAFRVLFLYGESTPAKRYVMQNFKNCESKKNKT